MCFIIGESRRVKRAEEDIVCYKRMRVVQNYPNPLEVRSTIFGLCNRRSGEPIYYKLNRTYTAKNGNEFSKNFKKSLKRLSPHSGMITSGFHSYKENYGQANIKCIIPKGTPYYENYKQYVSLKIKFIRGV